MKAVLPLLLMLVAAPALAHPGHGPESFGAGLLHPLTGLDHLLMLSGAGVLAALGNRPRTFIFSTLAAMLLGALAGQLLGAFSGMELLIALSLLAAGALIFAARRGRGAWLMPLLALAHGWAHGAEGNADGFGLFVAGFMLASSALLLAGYGIGALLRRHSALRRLAGAGWLAAAAMVLAG